MNWSFFLPYAIIFGIALASFMLRKLTLWAYPMAIFVAVFIYWGAGYKGLAMLGAFFLLGVIATSWHKHEKETLKPRSDQGNRRNLWQVLANGGVAAICGLLAYIYHSPTFQIMLAGSLAAAMADTLSSELGMVYGRRFYNVITFKTDSKGLDGVISLEGTLIGISGSVIIALISGHFWIIIVAGIIGNYIDSLLGATLERRHFLNNNLVNFGCTLAGALTAGVLAELFL